MSRSLHSPVSAVAALRSLGARCWFFRLSWRAPSGAVVVAVVPSSVGFPALRSFLVSVCGSARSCPVGWVVSFPVAGVAGVPAAVVSRLSGAACLACPPVRFASFVGVSGLPPAGAPPSPRSSSARRSARPSAAGGRGA